MFVTASDFNVLPYLLPSMPVPGKGEEFQRFIDSKEEDYLREVLGDNLYDAFISGLNDLPAEWDEEEPYAIGAQVVFGNDVWESLTDSNTGIEPVEGVDWTLIDGDNRWLLLKNGNLYMVNDKNYRWYGMVKTLKALIFSRWVEYNAQQLTINGFVTPKVENNYPVDPGTMICRAWNDWSKKVGGRCEIYNTLYGYLYYTNLQDGSFDDTFDSTFDTFIDYLAFEFEEQPTRNTFGI